MKHIISKEELLRRIRNQKCEKENYIITGVYKMPPCKPLHRIRIVPPLPEIHIDPENHPDLKMNLAPGLFLTGANRVYKISEVNRTKDLVKAVLIGYDTDKCMYSFTPGSIHEFKMEEFTSEFWMKYYGWRRSTAKELIKYGQYLTTVIPDTIIYDSSLDGYFKFIDHDNSLLKLSDGKEHFILKAILLYTEDSLLKRQYRDYPKSYYTDDTITSDPVINYKNIRTVNYKEYIELVTGIKDLELKESENPTTPIRFLFNCLLDSGTLKIKGKTFHITRLDETEVRCIEVTKNYKIISHTFNFNEIMDN